MIGNRGIEGMPLQLGIIVLIAAVMIGAVVYIMTSVVNPGKCAAWLNGLKTICETKKSLEVPLYQQCCLDVGNGTAYSGVPCTGPNYNEPKPPGC